MLENRYDDYPFQYSGGMRQRIVIAIALSCQPKILICDEPTTAHWTLPFRRRSSSCIKDLQKEFSYTIVFITHDLGVVANVAGPRRRSLCGTDRGSRHVPKRSSMTRATRTPGHCSSSSAAACTARTPSCYSITGTPPSLYNKIVGRSLRTEKSLLFENRCRFKAPPMFQDHGNSLCKDLAA